MVQELQYPLVKAVGNKGKTTAIQVNTMEEYVVGIAKDVVWVQGTLDTLFGPPLDTPQSSDQNSGPHTTAHHRTPPYTTIHHPPYTTIHHHTTLHHPTPLSHTTLHHLTPPHTTAHYRTPPHTIIHHHTPPTIHEYSFGSLNPTMEESFWPNVWRKN